MASTVDGASSVSAQVANMALDPGIPSAEEHCEGNRTAQGLKIYYDAGRNADIEYNTPFKFESQSADVFLALSLYQVSPPPQRGIGLG